MEGLPREEGEVTIPSSSRTIAPENSNDVLARVTHIVRTTIWYITNVVAYVAGYVRKQNGILWCIFSSCIAVSIDPLFFYIPVIDEKNKCLGMDKRLKTAALCLRALPDAAFALHTINYVFRIFEEEDDCFEILLECFRSILIGVFLILPIPQLAIVVFFFKSGGSGHFGQTVTTVNVFLVMHYLARVFLI